MLRVIVIAFWLIFLGSGELSAQYPTADNAAKLIQGATDLHIHSSPDMFARSVTDIEVAQLSKRYGLKAIVIKNHVSSTAARAALVNESVSGIDVYGGIVLNKAVGGINPVAVESMALLSPQYGKIVWFPTFDADGHKKAMGLDEEGVSIIKNGKLTEEALKVLEIILNHELILATGHLSSEEVMLLVETAHQKGIRKILITHAMGDAPNLSHGQMRKLAQWGAKLELTYLSYLSGPQSHLGFLKGSQHVSVEQMVGEIKAIGAEHFVLSSDLGQSGNPIPPDGLKHFIILMVHTGISEIEINMMVKTNPEALLR